MRFWAVLLLCLQAGWVSAQDQDQPVSFDEAFDQLEQAVPEPQKDVSQGEHIVLTTAFGTELDAFIAGPEYASIGVLVLHDRWGYNETVRQWVRRFAAQGYRALAIDVFDSRASDKAWLAEEIMNGTDPEAIKINLKAGVKYLKKPGRMLVTFGTGYGAWQSMQATLAAPDDVTGTIIAYGGTVINEDQARTVKSAVLGLFGEYDEIVTEDKTETLRLAMRKSLSPYRSYTYKAGYGFMDPGYPGYDEAAASQAWEQIDTFLETLIGQ